MRRLTLSMVLILSFGQISFASTQFGEFDYQLIESLDLACGSCHGDSSQSGTLSNETLQMFALQTESVSNCISMFTDPVVRVQKCFYKDGKVRRDLGVYRAAARDQDELLHQAGVSGSEIELFRENIMPPSATANPFDTSTYYSIQSFLANEARGGFLNIDSFRPPQSGAVQKCENRISPELNEYLAKTISSDGANWSNIHRSRGVPMFGCEETSNFPKDPKSCFKSTTLKNEWLNTNPDVNSSLRVLRSHTMFSRYWMRSSIDGRFVSNGGASPDGFYDSRASATIDDLAVNDPFPRKVLMSGSYDPAYTPDGLSFMWVDKICPIKPLLVEPFKRFVDLSAECKPLQSVTTYQSIGSLLTDPGSQVIVNNTNYLVDPGILGSIDPKFYPNNFLVLTQLRKDSAGRMRVKVSQIPMVGESQYSMFPSGALTISRSGYNGVPRSDQRREPAYQIRFLSKLLEDNNSYRQFEDETASQICLKGTKPMTSLDERFVVTHHYVDPKDEGTVVRRGSNIMSFDLKTLRSYQVTNMPDGLLALYPHFRADGWMYFLVKDYAQNLEYIMASDFALHL